MCPFSVMVPIYSEQVDAGEDVQYSLVPKSMVN
jgi:hypothetical protein